MRLFNFNLIIFIIFRFTLLLEDGTAILMMFSKDLMKHWSKENLNGPFIKDLRLINLDQMAIKWESPSTISSTQWEDGMHQIQTVTWSAGSTKILFQDGLVMKRWSLEEEDLALQQSNILRLKTPVKETSFSLDNFFNFINCFAFYFLDFLKS